MRPAAVGFQCPDDVAAGARSQRTPVNTLGGPATQRPPVVTYVLVALNVIAFALEGFPLGGLSAIPNDFVQRFVLYNPAIADEPYRLLTAVFLHASLVHIGLNMLVLVLIGRQLEQVLGWARYLAGYVVSGVGGSVLFYLLGNSTTYGLGASGAIFGLFSTFYLVARRLQADASSILATIGLNLVLTVLIPGISLWAHLGGLVTGAVIGLVYTQVPSRPPSLKAVQLALVAGIAALLVIAVVVRSASVA
ncbi:MAG TPA: rhomboid family intramembrane serine protease [Frankiaceae bacterium]|nr:rhomboid family intramembrane serine protease [Frankiaceae bacterium]